MMRSRLPRPFRTAGARALDLVDPLQLARLRRSGRLSGPVPSRRLRARVGEPGALAYVESGGRVAGEVEHLLAGFGRPLTSFSSIWDFGAGSGRVLTRLSLAPDARAAASDVDVEACRWLAEYTSIDARASSAAPPAPFEPESFDLVTAISVFTHIDEADQDRWLAEVSRVLRPGGLALLTIMGPGLLEAYRLGRRPGMTSAQRDLLEAAPLERSGIVFAAEPSGGRERTRRYPGTAASYGLTFHSEAYVREHWAEHLEVLDIVPSALNWGQDAVLCCRREG